MHSRCSAITDIQGYALFGAGVPVGSYQCQVIKDNKLLLQPFEIVINADGSVTYPDEGLPKAAGSPSTSRDPNPPQIDIRLIITIIVIVFIITSLVIILIRRKRKEGRDLRSDRRSSLGQQETNITLCDGPNGTALNCVSYTYLWENMARLKINATAYNGSSINSFSIYKNGTLAGSTTDGTYNLDNLSVGDYSIAFTSTDYETLYHNITINNTGTYCYNSSIESGCITLSREDNMLAIILLQIFLIAFFVVIVYPHKFGVMKFFSWSMAIIEILMTVWMVYINEIGESINIYLYINAYGVLVIGGLLGFITLFMVMVRLMTKDKPVHDDGYTKFVFQQK